MSFCSVLRPQGSYRSMLCSANPQSKVIKKTRFALPKLGFKCAQVSPFIKPEQSKAHYCEQHQFYVDQLNAFVASNSQLKDMSLDDLLTLDPSFLSNTTDFMKLQYLAGGCDNHNVFWKTLKRGVDKNGPDAEDRELIVDEFGSMEKMITEFKEAANSMIGSGWVWLVKPPPPTKQTQSEEKQVSSDVKPLSFKAMPHKKSIYIMTTKDEDSPKSSDKTQEIEPIIGLDLWEHSYYAEYGTSRSEYVSDFWKFMDWQNPKKDHAAISQKEDNNASL